MNTLWSQYRHHHRSEDRDRLVMHYLPVARRTIDHLSFRGNAVISKDDLFSHAVVGLMEAIDSYDPARGIRFETFAASRVRGAVLDALRCLDWMPRTFRRQQNELRRAYDELTEEIGRPPTNPELCARLNWTADALKEHIDRSMQSFIGSLDEPLMRGDEASESRVSGVPDAGAPDPQRCALQSDQHQRLRRSMGGLSLRERSVLQAYYFDNRTLKEIAHDLGVTESRVCQIHTQALKRLRQSMETSESLPV